MEVNGIIRLIGLIDFDTRGKNRLMFQFDDDQPESILGVDKEFHLHLDKDGFMIFESVQSGKKFKLFIQDID